MKAYVLQNFNLCKSEQSVGKKLANFIAALPSRKSRLVLRCDERTSLD